MRRGEIFMLGFESIWTVKSAFPAILFLANFSRVDDFIWCFFTTPLRRINCKHCVPAETRSQWCGGSRQTSTALGQEASLDRWGAGQPFRCRRFHQEMSLGFHGEDREVCRAQHLFCLGADCRRAGLLRLQVAQQYTILRGPSYSSPNFCHATSGALGFRVY